MKRLFLICSFTVSVAIGFAAQRCIAQDPAAVLPHYRLVPKLSTLHESGGIASIDRNYRLMGSYDFLRDSASTSAAFRNAEIWGSLISDLPTPAFVIDVDHLLNLEGLEGKQLPVMAPFDVFEFKGPAADGSKVDIFAALLGPWMYLHGSTQPPAGSADYFTYQLRALARTGPFADFNGDGTVDAADFAMLRKTGGVGADALSAGANVSDWRQQFGDTYPDVATMDAVLSAAAGSFLASSAIPEPACAGLALIGMILIAIGRRARAS